MKCRPGPRWVDREMQLLMMDIAVESLLYCKRCLNNTCVVKIDTQSFGMESSQYLVIHQTGCLPQVRKCGGK